MNLKITIVICVVLCVSFVLFGLPSIAEEHDEGQPIDRSGQIIDNAYELIIPEDQTYILQGEHTYSGHIYINGTLEIDPYDATPSTTTGTLKLIAPNIYINGLIDGRGRGYGGGGGGGGEGIHEGGS